MEVRDFTRVFDNVKNYLDETKVAELECAFLDDGMFVWNSSFRNAGKLTSFSEDIASFDLGLKEGEVVKYLSSLGCRMIIIGTFAGNVVIHQRTAFESSAHDGSPDNSPAIVVCYSPKDIEAIVGNKPLRQADLYRYTGFFNERENIGETLKRIRKSCAMDVA